MQIEELPIKRFVHIVCEEPRRLEHVFERARAELAASFPYLRAAQRRTPLGIVSADPQIGIVGGGHAALRDCEASAGEVSFANQGRARVQRINAERHSGRLLGAELFGP